MIVNGPDSKYAFLWRGEWRAVTHMLDNSNNETTNTLRAAKAVLFISHDQWTAVAVGPADLIERTDRHTSDRDWEKLTT